MKKHTAAPEVILDYTLSPETEEWLDKLGTLEAMGDLKAHQSFGSEEAEEFSEQVRTDLMELFAPLVRRLAAAGLLVITTNGKRFYYPSVVEENWVTGTIEIDCRPQPEILATR